MAKQARKTLWHPLFTREYPLYVVDMAADAYLRFMRPAIGWGYQDVLFVNRRGMITVHYSERDAQRFYQFCRGKPLRFFKQRNARIRQRAKNLMVAVRRLNRPEPWQNAAAAFASLHRAYQQLYAVYRFSPMVEFAAKIQTPKILSDCAQTKEAAGHAIKLADRTMLPRLATAMYRLSKIPKPLALYLRAAEIQPLLKTGHSPVAPAQLRRRHDRYVFQTIGRRTRLYTGRHAGLAAARLNIARLQPTKGRSIITGQVAHRGFARGRVVLVRRAIDLSKVTSGCIFVAPMTMPNHVSWIKKSAAIVTDEGGIICHAAIVSRELGIPCVVGTKIATAVLKDGNIVEVDANQGVIKIRRQ